MVEGRLHSERLTEFREVFLLFDKDGDGSISTKGLEAGMESLGRNPTTAEFQETINEVDTDGNGDIEFLKFLDMMSDRTNKPTTQNEVRETF